jgi:hypothetical protein
MKQESIPEVMRRFAPHPGLKMTVSICEETGVKKKMPLPARPAVLFDVL